MNSYMLHQDLIHRKLNSKDAQAIQSIAQHSGFTVPSSYMIWMLAETQADFCRVAINKFTSQVLGYILVFCTAEDKNLFIWQLAAYPDQKADALKVRSFLIKAVREVAVLNSVSRFYFSCEKRRVNRLRHLFQETCGSVIQKESSKFIQSNAIELMFSVTIQ